MAKRLSISRATLLFCSTILTFSQRVMRKNPRRWADVFLLISVLFGAWMRFMPTLLTGTPINDGGMFYVMILDLRAHRFLLPAFTSYNHLNIPFAYPPL